MNLYPFQVEAVNRSVQFLRTRGCVYNACEMGLGKSLQAIETCNKIGSKKVLVICPAVVRLVWAFELEKWAHDGIRFTVFSYNALVKDLDVIRTADYDTLILDEAHYAKSLEAQRTKAVLKIWDKAKYKICLSGTPFTQSIMDCWPIFSKMNPEDFADYWEFAKKYTKIVRTPWGKKYKFEGVKNHETLKKIINDKFFLRYTKEKVLKDLPDKTFQLIPLGSEYLVKRSADQEADYERYLELLKESIVKKTPPPTPPIALATTIKEQGIKKVKPIAEFARNLLDNETPIVIFCYHTEFIRQLQEELASYAPVTIEGKTIETQRGRSVNDFQAGNTNLFIGQIKAAGVGITLTRSSTVLLAEYSFSPADIQQAIDRTHRIGQKNPVTVYYFSVAGSTDEKIQEVLMQKSTTFKKVLG